MTANHSSVPVNSEVMNSEQETIVIECVITVSKIQFLLQFILLSLCYMGISMNTIKCFTSYISLVVIL